MIFVETNICRTCAKVKLVSEFSRDSRMRSGLKPSCKECVATQARERRSKDPAFILRQQKKAELRAHLAPARQHRVHWNGVLTNTNYHARSMDPSAPSLTMADVRGLLADLGERCAYCGTSNGLGLDHRVPLCRGGSNTVENVVPACGDCNRRKGRKTDVQFLANLCWRDHPMTPENTYLNPRGTRHCIACQREWSRNH